MEFDSAEFNRELNRAVDTHFASALLHVLPLAERLMDDPDRAIDDIFVIYDRALNDAYRDDDGRNDRALVESIAGGPHEAVPWAVYNAVGTAYPYLEREQRDKALEKILQILDKRNYLEVNGAVARGHTTGIREPLLLADIVLARPPYWPGLFDEQHIWKDKLTFWEIQNEIMDENKMFRPDKVNSDFLVATAFLNPRVTQFGEAYAEAVNPAFLERVLKGNIAIEFGRKKVPEEIEERKRELLEALPETLHDRLDPILEEADWVDYTKFN
jgi:hypothetical protein